MFDKVYNEWRIIQEINFVEAWLTDDRQISRYVSDNNLYNFYYNVCNKTFLYQSKNISKHAIRTYHKNNI